MKYIIYKLLQPQVLKEINTDDWHPKTIERTVLERLNIYDVEEEHATLESALAEINNKKESLKHLTLTVIPVISINWNGEIN